MKKIAAITIASTLLISSLGSVVFADTTTTAATTPAQSSITVPATTDATTIPTAPAATTTVTAPAGSATNTTTTTTTTTTTAATTAALPTATTWVTKLNIPADSVFYPILKALEQLQLFLTTTQEQKAQLTAELAAKRVSEAQYLAAQAKLDEATNMTNDQIAKLTERTTKLMEEAQAKLEEAQKLTEKMDEQKAEEEKATIAQINQHRFEVLSRVYLKVPATAKPAILKNLIKFGATEAQIKALNDLLQGKTPATTTTDTNTTTNTNPTAATQTQTVTGTTTAPTVTNTPQVTDKELELRLPPGIAKKLGDDKQGWAKNDKDKEDHGKGQGNKGR